MVAGNKHDKDGEPALPVNYQTSVGTPDSTDGVGYVGRKAVAGADDAGEESTDGGGEDGDSGVGGEEEEVVLGSPPQNHHFRSRNFDESKLLYEFFDVPSQQFEDSFLDSSQYEEPLGEQGSAKQVDEIRQKPNGDARGDAESVDDDEEVEDEEEEEGVGDGIFPLVLLLCLQFWCGAALSILAPFYTSEATKKGLTVTMSSTVFATVFILQIVFTPLFGRYITRIGSVRLLVAGSVASGLGSIGFGLLPFIHSVELFFGLSLVMRGLTALGESAINTAVYPLSRGLASSKYAMTVLSCVETIYGLGTMLGPFLGGLLFEFGGFYLPFLVCGVLLVGFGLFSGLTIYCRRCRIKKVHQRKLSQEDLENLSLQEEINEQSSARIKITKVLKKPGVLEAAFITILTGMSSQWFQPTLEPFLASVFGLSTFVASMFLVIDGATYALLSPLIGIMIDRKISLRLLLMFGCASICVSHLLMGPLLYLGNTPMIQIGFALAVHGIGLATNFIGSLTALTNEVVALGAKLDNLNPSDQVSKKTGPVDEEEDEEAHGLATSIWITCDCFGAFLGSTLGGVLYEKQGWNISCITVLLLLFLGLIVCIVYSLTECRKRSREEERLVQVDVVDVDEQTALISKTSTVTYGSNNNIRSV